VEELKKLMPDWSKISIPVTVVQGGGDNIVDPENLEFAKRQLRGKKADFIFLPNAGHLIRFQNPEVVRSILLKDAGGKVD
jgi:pimeloyl-ACP methyl ester carboxylesterase